MKRLLLLLLSLTTAGCIYSQNSYYWVGGTAVTSFTSNSNWNTQRDGSGTARTAAASDILIIDGINIGGTVPTTGTVTTNISTTNFGQLKLVNNASLVMQRPAGGGGTGTITINGGTGDDLVVESGSSLSAVMPTADGNAVIALAPGATGRVSGSVTLANSAHRIVSQTVGGLVFTSGSSATTNATTNPFGGSSGTPAATQLGVVFESGANLYYNGGSAPVGNSSTYTVIDFRSGSNFYLRATRGTGSFLNARTFGNIIVDNDATFVTDGPVNYSENFTVAAGATFTTHTSGSTVIAGSLTVNGTFNSPAASTNVLVMAGSVPQTISGTGTINIAGFTVADHADVSTSKNIVVNTAAGIYGKINFTTAQLSGPATFTSRVNNNAAASTGTLVAGSYQVTSATGTLTGLTGLTVTGTGIAPNTTVVAFSATNATINLSKPIVSNGTAVALAFASDTATIATAHANGLDSLTGSVIVTGAKTYQGGTNYIINAPTTWPLGVTTGSGEATVRAGFVQVNAPVTLNRDLTVYDQLSLNGKLTLRPTDTVEIATGAVISGAISANNYIATTGNSSSQSALQYHGVNGSTLLPIGTAAHYLPLTLQPTSASEFIVYVFEGITTNGLPTGTPLTPAQKLTVVNAVWNINQVSGSSSAGVQIQWDGSLEGASFTTLPDDQIGLIANTGSSYALPIGTGDNSLNTASATVSSFGSFSAGAVPQVAPFVFNAPADRTYGDADFNPGATSLNTTQPIVYTSSNTAVATIVGGMIHITGAGTTNITASQASDGFYPAASVTQPLLVNKAVLVITADNKTKVQDQSNPTLTATFASFVLGETPAVFLTPLVISTTAVTNSIPGTYPITVSGATAANYTISFVPGTLTVTPRLNQTITFNTLAAKNYGNADFALTATSTNNTIPITYTSSNTAVATITGNTVHIVGAGTTNITASQAGNIAYFPATDVVRPLTVNKVPLTIRVRDTTRLQGAENPVFTITYTGFVNGDNASRLTPAPVANTIATPASAPGYYTVTADGAVSANYTITTVAGRLTVLPLTGTGQEYINAYMSNSTTLTVRAYVPEPRLADIILYDMGGRPVFKRNVFLPVGFMNFDVPVASLPMGVYVVTIRGNGVDLKIKTRILK